MFKGFFSKKTTEPVSYIANPSLKSSSNLDFPTLEQSYLIKKMKTWLKIKKYTCDSSDTMEKGLCAGFTSAWLYYYSIGKIEYFYSILEKIALWDEKDKGIDSVFEEAMNFVLFMQSPEKIYHDLYQPSMSHVLNRIMPSNRKVAPPEFQVSLLLNDIEAHQFFSKLLPLVKEKMVFLSCGNHICGLYINAKNEVHYYDSNNPRGDKIIYRVLDLVDSLRDSFFCQKKSYIPLSCSVVNYEGKPAASYQKVEKVLPDLTAHVVGRGNSMSSVSALYLAVSYSQYDWLDKLLTAGANPDDGLWVAAALGDKHMVRQLLSAGADPYRLNHQWKSAIDCAKYYKHDEVLAMLIMNEKSRSAMSFTLSH